MASDFTMYSGDTCNIAVTITDTDGDAVDLTGATSSWSLSLTPGDTAILTKTSGAGEITYSGASTNIATIALDASDTASLAGVYHHELQVTDASSNVSTVVAGAAVIRTDTV